MKRLILDADGVFLNERPYWDAALATALLVSGLSSDVDGRWDCLTNAAFGRLGMQRLTKGRGCNSNWDLAVVLAKALQIAAVRGGVADCLAKRCEDQAMTLLADAVNGLWTEVRVGDAALRIGLELDDPLRGFGVDRGGYEFGRIRKTFQGVLQGTALPGRDAVRPKLLEDEDTVRSTLAACRTLGFEIWVCTGRCRSEILTPIATFGLDSELQAQRVVSGDDVVMAERLRGVRPLGKPHWFSPACAAVGFEGALGLLAGVSARTQPSSAVYVGDALADFRAVRGCGKRGLDIAYVHVRSGLTMDMDEQAIADSPMTLGIIDRLSELPRLIGSE